MKKNLSLMNTYKDQSSESQNREMSESNVLREYSVLKQEVRPAICARGAAWPPVCSPSAVAVAKGWM